MLVLLGIGAVAFAWQIRRSARFDRLVAEIQESGGKVDLGPTYGRQVWDRLQGWRGDWPTRVELGPDTTSEWVRSWDDLTDLSIHVLKVNQPAELGPELVRLVERHPLEQLLAPGAKGADEIATALSASWTLRGLHLRDSDLTDEGLGHLPLERLWTLNIAGTQVTANGLAELRRLPPMSKLVLDCRQVTTETMTLLEQNPNSYMLWLHGPDVTDDTLQTVKTALGPGDTHKLLMLFVGQRQVSRVSLSATQAWQRDVPSVRITYTSDAEPGPSITSRGFTPPFWSRWFGR